MEGPKPTKILGLRYNVLIGRNSLTMIETDTGHYTTMCLSKTLGYSENWLRKRVETMGLYHPKLLIGGTKRKPDEMKPIGPTMLREKNQKKAANTQQQDRSVKVFFRRQYCVRNGKECRHYNKCLEERVALDWNKEGEWKKPEGDCFQPERDRPYTLPSNFCGVAV